MKTESKRRSRIIRLVLLMAVLAASQTIGFETSWKLQTVNATLSSSSAFQYIVTILMENNGLCDVTPSVVSGCSSSSIPAPYLTTLAQTYGFSTHTRLWIIPASLTMLRCSGEARSATPLTATVVSNLMRQILLTD